MEFGQALRDARRQARAATATAACSVEHASTPPYRGRDDFRSHRRYVL